MVGVVVHLRAVLASLRQPTLELLQREVCAAVLPVKDWGRRCWASFQETQSLLESDGDVAQSAMET